MCCASTLFDVGLLQALPATFSTFTMDLYYSMIVMVTIQVAVCENTATIVRAIQE